MTKTPLPPELVSKTTSLMAASHYAVLNGSMSLHGQNEATEGYAQRITLLDAAILSLSRGKWLYGRATGELADFADRTSSAEDLDRACRNFDDAVLIANSVSNTEIQSAPLLHENRTSLTGQRELTWFHETPIVPNVCPIVLLAGSSFDMGRQYARQCIEIFGEFIFERSTKKGFSSIDQGHLHAWMESVRKHAPEMLHMSDGIAEGAKLQGVALNREQAFALWVGMLNPAETAAPIGVLDAYGGGVMGSYFGDQTEGAPPPTDIREGLCSAAAAWGSATSDGQLHFSASTDHDCTFQVTIIAYPDEGHPFLYTPFSVNGSVPGVGRFGLAGHPGFNTSGLAYIHHGGGGGCAEASHEWGYGVPRGVSTMHILRFGSSSQDAKNLEASFPIGDVGRVLGAPGGFYADDREGYVFESRDHKNPMVRQGTYDPSGARQDFLYATNNIISKGINSPAFPSDGKSSWDPIEGWKSQGDDTDTSYNVGLLTRRWWSVSATSRNRYLYERLMARNGSLDLASMVSLFRLGPDASGVSWNDAERAMNAGGDIAHPSAGHRLNAFVAAGTPTTRKYLAAIGPLAHRSVSPNRPGHGYFIHDETNAHWEITLADSIDDVVAIARRDAIELAEQADRALSGASLAKDGAERLYRFQKEVKSLLNSAAPSITANNATDDVLSLVSKTMRCYTRAQVRARQILQAINPPDEWNAKRQHDDVIAGMN